MFGWGGGLVLGIVESGVGFECSESEGGKILQPG